MSTTVSSGSTATFGMDAFASLAVVPNSNTARGTITFTSAAPNSDRPSFTAKLQAKEFGPFLVPMSVSIVVEDGSCTYQLTGHAGGYSYDSSGNVTGLVGPDGTTLPSWITHSGCLFHGFAVSQAVDDTAFFDRSGRGNHGVFGADLSVANAWANAGYVSTVDPAGGATDSVIRIPSLAYDYASDESLVIFWRGKVTAEGSAMPLFGDTDSASTPGFKLMVQSTGKVGVWLSKGDGSFIYCGNSNTTIGSGSLVSFALVLYGKSKLYQYLSEGAVDYLPTAVPAGVPLTLTASTFNVGAASPSPGGTVGISVKTRGLAIYKFSAQEEPVQADVIAAMQQWLAATDRLLTQDAM